MAAREAVSRDRIVMFLAALGREVRHPARMYLSGGEGLVWRGLRVTTRDVDIAYEVDPKHHAEWIRVLRDLKESMRISIEEASPGAFIPLPEGAEGRAKHIGRYGLVDVYLFDPYSVALSKLERGHARDLEDVRMLLEAGILQPVKLRALFEDVSARFERMSLKADLVRFRAMLEQVLKDVPDTRPTQEPP